MEEAKAIGVYVDSGVDEREAATDGIILVDPRTDVGSKKTVPDIVSFAARSEWDLPYLVC